MVWVASPGAVPGSMTDGLTEVNGVSCQLLLSDDISMGRISSNGSILGLVGKISADPNTLRNATSESTDSSCIIAWVSSLVLKTWLRALKALTASSSLNSILNCAMAEASVRDRGLLAGSGIREEPDVATVASHGVNNGTPGRRNAWGFNAPSLSSTINVVDHC